MKKKFLCSTLAAVTTIGMMSGAALADDEAILIAPLAVSPNDVAVIDILKEAMPYEDVTSETEFYEAIKYCYDNKIMNGIETTKFAPDNTLTRAMLVTILYRADGEPAFMNDLVFNDVVRGSYYEKAVVWAQGKGIVNGISDTEFAPDANITREQLATILYRYAKYKNLDIEKATENTNTLSFDDIMDISEYASPAVHACLANGALLDNRESMKILPKADATRAEAANAIMVIKNLPVAEEPTLPTYEELAGTYSDSVSQRAHMEVASGDECINIKVEWANSAFENVEWTMTAKYAEDNTLAYEDCIKKTVTYAEDGTATEKVEYENGKGYFTTDDGKLIWVGASEESCQSCIFVVAE